MKIQPRDRILLGAVAAIAAVAAFYLLVLAPESHRATKLSRSIAAAQTQLASAQTAYAEGRAAQHRLGADVVEYEAAGDAVPQRADVPGLLRLLQRTADDNRVSLQSIGLSSSSSASATTGGTAASSTTGTTGTTGGTGTAGSQPQPIPVTLAYTGSYQALNGLLRRLNSLVAISHGRLRATGPLVSVNSVSLSPGSSGKAALSASISATIYQYADPSSVIGDSTSGGS